MRNVGVVLAHDDPSVAEAIAHTLEAEPELFLAGTSSEALARADVVVAGGDALERFRAQRSDRPLVALADGDPIRAARAALAVGAREIIRWPDERLRLAPAIRSAAHAGHSDGTRGTAGRSIAVVGARGGVGTSTLVAGLAAVCGESALVLDLDPSGAAQANFCKRDPERTLGDLAPLGDEVGPEALSSVLVEHAGGARALLASTSDLDPDPKHARALVRAARATAGLSFLDCGRGAGAGQRAAAAEADVRAILVTLDVPALRGARALIEQIDGAAEIVIRRARGASLRPRDVPRALGVERVMTWPDDRRVARAVDLGRVRRDRSLRRLASALMKDLR
jgi:pilus assembly protein CpaE